MKKMICVFAVVLMVASVAYAQKKMAIKAEDLPKMTGLWEGNISFGITEGQGSSATLEIFNDKVPVKAKLTIRQVPEVVASPLGISTGTNVMESEEGALTSQGTIMFTGPAKGFFEVSKKGDKKITAVYWFKGLRGDASFTKK